MTMDGVWGDVFRTAVQGTVECTKDGYSVAFNAEPSEADTSNSNEDMDDQN